jgi:hypothetical protein
MSHPLHTLTLLLPVVATASAFLLAWLGPALPGAATAEDCRTIMILEGLSILAAVLVGGYRETALTFFPPVVVGCVVWLFATGTAGLSWIWAGFVWHVVQAFIDGVRAHRGEFGLAGENPDHPHRRYDRLVFLYVGTAAVFPIVWLLGRPAHWAIWGTLYFALSAAVDTVLRDQFERIPRGVLRWMKKRLHDPQIAAQIGICRNCRYVQPAIPARAGRMIRCCLSVTDPKFPEYPASPIHTCAGFRRPVSEEAVE